MADSTLLQNISVVGLGKLGAPMVACLASNGRQVIGVDLDARKVEAIRRLEPPVFEPGLVESLRASTGRLTATGDIGSAVLATQATFIVVATPSGPDGGFSLRYVLPVCEAVGRALRKKREFHLVVLTSTVMPGSTDGPVRAALERASGKRIGKEIGLCYNPEFIALGSVILDFLNPDFVLVGESDTRSGDMLERLYKSLCANDPPVVRMNAVNAELTKLSINSFVTAKITFANMLARICEGLPGADVETVTGGLGHDTRIGPRYLRGAIGYGGPCFPRDNAALALLASQLGAPNDLPVATHRANREEVSRLATLIRSKLAGSGPVAILGLAYKPDTDVVEESQGCLLALELSRQGMDVVAYDPAAMEPARRMLGGAARLADSIGACVEGAAVVVVTTPWEVFRGLGDVFSQCRFRPATVIDCWRILKEPDLGGSTEYVPLGRGPLAYPDRETDHGEQVGSDAWAGA